jgi:enoyl-CoA hydratase/carnithine racemase
VQFDFGYSVQNGIATITFNRPDVLNALTLDIYAQVRDLLEDLRYEDDVKVLVITGEGRGFCSGGDVHEIIGALLERDMRAHLEFTRMTGALVGNMRLLDKPIIAAVNGTAAGAGAVISLASDLCLASEQAKFAFLFTKVGLTGADMGSAYLLPRLVGLGRATELLMLGDKVDADRALAIGLATEIVDDDALPGAAGALARRLANGPALAYSQTKLLLAREQDMDLAGAIEMEALVQALLMKSHDHGEFYRAWSDGRKPAWAGR